MDRRNFIALGLSMLGACGRASGTGIEEGIPPEEAIDSIVAHGIAP